MQAYLFTLAILSSFCFEVALGIRMPTTHVLFGTEGEYVAKGIRLEQLRES